MADKDQQENVNPYNAYSSSTSQHSQQQNFYSFASSANQNQSTSNSPAPSSPSMNAYQYNANNVNQTSNASGYNRMNQHHFSSKLNNSSHYSSGNLNSGSSPNLSLSNIHSTSATHQKQIELANISRQSSSAHHHARMAIASSRQQLNNKSNDDLEAEKNNPDGTADKRASEWTVLDLGGMLIKNLSPSIFQYVFLTSLYLNHNNLTYLHPSISKLIHLVCLDLSGNKLTTIPHELGILGGTLKELLMYDNELVTLPHELGFLFQLETLGIEGNPIGDPIAALMHKDGTAMVVQYLRDNCPVGPPPPEREWISLEEDDELSAGNPNQSDTFTVLCYNTLCDKYASPSSYAYTPSWVLNWEYRKELILQEILNYNADIVCLQEVEASQYEDYFREQMSTHGEYDSLFYPKSRSRTMDDSSKKAVDGCATFWKNSKFSIVEKHLMEFQQLAMQHKELQKTEDVYNRVMIKDNICVVTLLEVKDTKQRLMVSNCHLHWDPLYRDVKLVQTAMMVEELQNLCEKYAALSTPSSITTNKPLRYPLLICGDFNSLPDSGVCEYLTRGIIPQDHDDFMAYKYGNYTLHGLSHKLSLRSCYSHRMEELDFTNFTPGFKGVIDYIWYSTNSLDVTGLLANIERDYIAKSVGFPNWHHPSDHIPLVVSLKFKPTEKKITPKFK